MSGRKGCPGLLFAAPESGSGKTMAVCGFLTLLLERGIRPVSFKCGPDYIDPLFHRQVLGVPGCNLDSFFLEEDGVRRLFDAQSAGADFAVLEGVMGYYDGLAGISTRASSYDIARITDMPVVLVVDAKRCSLSAAALVKGFLSYRPDSRICGVILNRTSDGMGERLRPFLEEQGVALFGCLPELPEFSLESRHLGLVLPTEQSRLREKLSGIAAAMERHLDVEAMLSAAGYGAKPGAPREAARVQADAAGQAGHFPPGGGAERRLAVALDEAFCFYYEENLQFLRELGYTLCFFSPLHDRALPEGAEAVLLGGGYPECFAEALSGNVSFLQSLRGAYASGIKILAECGGFLYLHEGLEGMDGKGYPMAGLLQGMAFRGRKLSRFGYVTLQDPRNPQRWIRAHEFHYWESPAPGDAMRAQKPLSSRSWPCMHRTQTLLAGFPHLYYRSNPALIREFLET